MGVKASTEAARRDTVAKFQEIFDSSENTPQHTPIEISELYPGLTREDNREALREVAKASNTPRGSHLMALMKVVRNMRSGLPTDYESTWETLRAIFKGESARTVLGHLFDIVSLWICPYTPTAKPKMIEGLTEYQDSKYARAIFNEYMSLTPDRIEGAHKVFQKLKKDAIDKYLDTGRLVYQDTAEQIEDAQNMLTAVSFALEGDLASVWECVQMRAEWQGRSPALVKWHDIDELVAFFISFCKLFVQKAA